MAVQFDVDPKWKNIYGAAIAKAGYCQSFDTQMSSIVLVS